MLLDPSLLLSYLVVATVVALSPGPDALFVLAVGLENTRSGAVAASFGVCVGTVLHTLGAAVGVTTVVATIPYSFDVLRVCGAAYLFYLGWQALRRAVQNPASVQGATPVEATVSATSLFCRGLLTNLLNPKVILFYIALLPQFVSIESGHIGLQILLLGGIHSLIGLVFLTGVGLAAHRVSARIRGAGFMRWLSVVAGMCFIGLALRLVILEQVLE